MSGREWGILNVKCKNWGGNECLRDLFNLSIKKVHKVFGIQEDGVTGLAGKVKTKLCCGSLQGSCADISSFSL